MSGKCVPAEQHMNKSFTYEPRKSISASRMYNGRATNKKYFGPDILIRGFRTLDQILVSILSNQPHTLGDIGNNMLMRPFRRDLCFHKRKYITSLWSLQRKHLNTASTCNDTVSFFYGSHRYC